MDEIVDVVTKEQAARALLASGTLILVTVAEMQAPDLKENIAWLLVKKKILDNPVMHETMDMIVQHGMKTS